MQYLQSNLARLVKLSLRGWVLTGLISALVIYAVFSFVQRNRAATHYHEGLRFYMAGNLAESERELERAYRLNKKDRGVRKLLSRVLFESALNHVESREYERAVSILSKAQEFSDEKLDIKMRIESLVAKIGSKSDAETQTSTFVLPKKMKNLSASDRFILRMVNHLMQTTDVELKLLQQAMALDRETLASELSKAQSRSRRELWIGLTLFVVLFFGSLGVLLWMIRRAIAKSFLLPGQPHAFFPESKWFAQELSSSLLPYSAIKAQKIVAIEAELTGEGDKEIAVRLLRPFLDNKDPWIKAKAARALHRYDPALALTELEQLVQGEGGKVPAVLALGEIGSEDSVNVIIRSFPDFDKETAKVALQSLFKLSHSSKTEEVIVQKIVDFLDNVRSTGEWVI